MMSLKPYLLAAAIGVFSTSNVNATEQYCQLPDSVQSRFIKKHEGTKGEIYLVDELHMDLYDQRNVKILAELAATKSIDAIIVEGWVDMGGPIPHEIHFGWKNPLSPILKEKGIPVFGGRNYGLLTKAIDFLSGYEYTRTINFYHESREHLLTMDKTRQTAHAFVGMFGKHILDFEDSERHLSIKHGGIIFTWDIVNPVVMDEREQYVVDMSPKLAQAGYKKIALNWGIGHNLGFISKYSENDYTVCVLDAEELISARQLIEMRNEGKTEILQESRDLNRIVFEMAKFRAQAATKFEKQTDWYDFLGPFYTEPELKNKRNKQ